LGWVVTIEISASDCKLGVVVVLGQGWTDSDFEMVPFCRGFLRKLRAFSGLLMGFFCGWYVLEVSFGE